MRAFNITIAALGIGVTLLPIRAFAADPPKPVEIVRFTGPTFRTWIDEQAGKWKVDGPVPVTDPEVGLLSTVKLYNNGRGQLRSVQYPDTGFDFWYAPNPSGDAFVLFGFVASGRQPLQWTQSITGQIQRDPENPNRGKFSLQHVMKYAPGADTSLTRYTLIESQVEFTPADPSIR
jgi:hypothetical protein